MNPDSSRSGIGISQRLDQAFRHTAANLPKNASVRIEEVGGDPDLVLSPLDKLEEPESLVALRAVEARMPRVDLPELVLEIQARTGFADAFCHASEAERVFRILPQASVPFLFPKPVIPGLSR